MTKKDYQLIASAIYASRRISSERPWDGEQIIQYLAHAFEANDPRFDPARFIRACETGSA